MSWRETNERLDRWAARHPIRYAVALGLFLAALQLSLSFLYSRPLQWPVFLLWVIVFPVVMATIARRRYRSGSADNHQNAPRS